MGVNSRLRDIRPPLPAPTESMLGDEGGTNSGPDTDVATNITTQTDKTSYEVPEDGKPITISTQKITSGRERSHSGRQLDKSQTSLLIEYFEGAKGDKTRSRPSVRVKVTPSARKKNGSGGADAVQITGIGKDRKPSYTRRISLGSSKNAEVGLAPPEGTEVSQSSDSNLSGRPPIEVEVLNQNGSDLSSHTRSLMYANESNVSSMPPDSMLEGSYVTESDRSRTVDRDDDSTVKDFDYLQEPQRQRDRSASRERIAQRVMEKLGQTPTKQRKSSRSKSERSLDEEYSSERRRKSTKSHRYDEDTVSGAESSMLSSNTGQQSYRSGSDVSKQSMTNNPKLLGMVEDTIKRIILPEINAIKEDQRNDRALRSAESSRRPSLLEDMYGRKGLERNLSKSSSSPNISSKPKVVLNRDGEDPGVVLSRGDSERKKTRKSSKGSYTEERPSSRRSSGSRSTTKLRDVETTSTAGGGLTAAALKSHDSESDVRSERKRRSKSRSSQSRSVREETDEGGYLKPDIPPMPMASRINESELTRDSIVSVDTETPQSLGHTPVHEVSRGSLRDAASPAYTGTPSMTPVPGGLGMSHTNQSIDSPGGSYGGQSSLVQRMAALGIPVAGGAATTKSVEETYDHVDADGYGSSPVTQRNTASPGVQSVSSLKQSFEGDSLMPGELRPRSAASRSSAGRDKNRSQSSLRSGVSSPPSTKLGRSRPHSRSPNGDEFATPMEYTARESTPGTPTYGESADDWYERQHQLNDRYRDSLDVEGSNRDSFAERTNRDSYQTNPYPQDEKRFTFFSEDGQEVDRSFEDVEAEQDVRGLGANPEYVHTPYGAESAVASLVIEPSTVSSSKSQQASQQPSPTKANASFSARLRELGKDSAPVYQGSTLSQTMPSQDRWQALKGRARDMSSADSRDDLREVSSPNQSPAKSLREERSRESQPVMGASGLPVADDPIPEIGHFDDSKSDVTTNPSIIQGPLGGDATGKDPWPYTPEPNAVGQRELGGRGSQASKDSLEEHKNILAAAAAGTAALRAATYAARKATAEDEDDDGRSLTPDVGGRGDFIDREATPTSPAAFRDEGYVTDAHARSSGALTPRAEQRYTRKDVDEFNRAMEQYDGGEDPFTGDVKHSRHVSGNSHGMASPLYDSSTGKGIENIQSKDIVALMDHLTVRDAQRNARDTEILVSLVRSTAEMRQNLDDMKRFIAEQDRVIMQNADRNANQTVQKVLGGPRPPPTSSPRTPRTQSEEDVQTKRKGVLRRALKGLTGGKSSNDLSKVEDMLMQILDNVEDLKHQGVRREPLGSYTNDSLDTYERLRNAPDSGYEPEGQAGTSSTPSHSGGLSLTPRGEKHQFHSGYDGRRNSVNRVSTVVEDDEDGDLEPHESHILDHQNEGQLTPTQEMQRIRGFTPDYPYHAAGAYNDNNLTPRSTEKQRKHKSNSSSVFGAPKISRWSKTTSSSAAPDPATVDSPNLRNQKSVSDASRSGSALDEYDDDQYSLRSHESRVRSKQSLARENELPETRSMRSQASKISRTPSPLIPSEASYKQHDEYEDVREPSPIQEDLDVEFDDPKYQAHRNSLLLQHPQPRPGTTGRHQNTLETQAQRFDGPDPSATSSDVSQRSVSDFDPSMWGSSGTAGLAKHRMSQMELISPESMDRPRGYGGARRTKDDDSLISQQKPAVPPKIKYEPEPEYDYEQPQYSNSGFSKGGYYSSPFGSGHLLEPIEEVASIASTRSGGLSPEPQVTSAQAVDMRSTARKITGPRPMGSRRSPQPQEQPKLVETTGTVRRKPVSGSR
ncbi:hypothetical protein LTR37_013697 [Vermiconidia calcicola]|uniref:Uncharacterized protein n=1 Tax=Vermiconidia calcicola TaxID=1690605 RepID=A0ACC3MW07_9PEZI|nr:hypothetical protein LTR37_013697 [Vermiconidia calcicola]